MWLGYHQLNDYNTAAAQIVYEGQVVAWYEQEDCRGNRVVVDYIAMIASSCRTLHRGV